MGNIWDDVKRQTRITRHDLLIPPPPKEKIILHANNVLPPGSIVFDLETGSVTEMWSSQDPGFIRLVGHSVDNGPVQTSPRPDQLLADIKNTNGWIIGHNIMNFDSILLDKFYGLNILKLAKAGRLYDTKLLAFLSDPPLSRTKEGEIEKIYSLENQGQKYLGEGKMVDVVTGKSVLKELAKTYGGFEKIPQDDQQYNDYCKRDVEATRDLVKAVEINDYARREHKIAAVAATISLQGFRVDVDLLKQRIQEGEEKKAKILNSLMVYGLPSPESTKAPQMTKVGKIAIDTAFKNLGVSLDRTATGLPALGKPVLEAIVASSDNQEVIDLAEAVMSLNGIRTIYGNIFDNLVGDRVHPSINLRQSTGRWSIQKPGLTVIGKRGGKVIERAVFLPEENHVLISCDLSQVDARAVAALSQDTEYLKLFEPGRDLHTEMAKRLLGDASLREKAKVMGHGLNYSMRANKLALTTGLSVMEAEDFIHEFEANFPRLTDWQREIRIEGETIGLLYNGFGRRMRVDPERTFTQAPALMGQSTARDILCEGVLNLWDIGGEGVIKMIKGVIHDELVLSVRKEDAQEIGDLVVKALSFEWCPVGGTYPVQIIAGLGPFGANWCDAYPAK